MQRIHRCFDVAVLVLMLGAPVIIWLTDGDAGRFSHDGRASLLLRLAWGIAVLIAALRMPVISLTRRLRDWRDARLRESNKASLLATLNSWSKPGSGRCQWHPPGGHRLAGSAVGQATLLPWFGFGEGAGLIPVREPPREATFGGRPIESRAVVPRDRIAGMDGLSPYDPLPARTFEIGITAPARPVGHMKFDVGEGVEGFGEDLQGVVDVVAVQAWDGLEGPTAGVLAIVGAEPVPIPPHPLDQAVPPTIEAGEQGGLGPVPDRRRAGELARGESEPEFTGFTVHLAGASDDQGNPPRRSVVQTAPEGVSQSMPSHSPCGTKSAGPGSTGAWPARCHPHPGGQVRVSSEVSSRHARPVGVSGSS